MKHKDGKTFQKWKRLGNSLESLTFFASGFTNWSFHVKLYLGKLDEVTSGPELREKSEEETTAEPVSELESQSEADGDEPKSKDQLHPMDCMDIILGASAFSLH